MNAQQYQRNLHNAEKYSLYLVGYSFVADWQYGLSSFI